MIVDIECYTNYFLACFSNGEDFELFDDWSFHNGQHVERGEWHRLFSATLRSDQQVTFNGERYDMRIIALAERGASNVELKRASDAIIVYKMKPWELIDNPQGVDHVDLFEVAPGQGSLKAYAAKMHSRRLQDLPIDPAAHIDQAARLALREYCALGDLPATADLERAMSAQLELRREMTAEYGVDLRSKSDAQIAETVMRKLLPFRVQIPPVQYGAKFYYRPPEWVRFQNLQVLDLLARSPFTIGATGHPVMTEELENTLVRIGDMAYQMGSGGLHSTESKIAHVADDEWMISDHDVASYYPSLILRTGIEPMQLGGQFQAIYRGWYETRLHAKRAGKKKRANSLKTLLNGTFGKLASMWSVFYAPAEMTQVTLTGQLALLMLIEMFEMSGIQVLQANTDGIVVRVRRRDVWVRDQVLRWWETATGMETEETQYRLIASRDVNSYVAIKPDGEVKTKGAYAPPEPGASGWPNPTGQVSVDAAVAYLRDGTPVRETVRGCADIRQFVHVRNVKGGGAFMPNGVLPKKTTLKAMRALCGDLPKDLLLQAYAEAVAARSAEREYLGKVVRWYYAIGSSGCIVTPADGLVARTEGCRPCMTLPDALPWDMDFDWYEREAIAMLAAMGVPYIPDVIKGFAVLPQRLMTPEETEDAMEAHDRYGVH